MARLGDANVSVAREIIGRYPRPKSAVISLLHLAQEQHGWVSNESMTHIAELVGVTPAEVYGTASFYEMFKFEPVGRYCISVCTNISCQLLGAWELLEHAEHRLGVHAGSTTEDGMFTLEDVECVAACTEAPAVQVNSRYRTTVTPDDFDVLVDELAAGRRRERSSPAPRPVARWRHHCRQRDADGDRTDRAGGTPGDQLHRLCGPGRAHGDVLRSHVRRWHHALPARRRRCR